MNYFFRLTAFIVFFTSCTHEVHENINNAGQKLQQAMIWQDDSGNNLDEPLSVGFRKQVEIDQVPENADVMIFADSRYVLWINGRYIERGPCRFDPKGPQYDEIDVTEHFFKGLNTIAIMVQGYVKGSLKVMKHDPGLG